MPLRAVLYGEVLDRDSGRKVCIVDQASLRIDFKIWGDQLMKSRSLGNRY